MDGLRVAMSTLGYDGASIQSIAEAAGLSPGLIHYHFGTKLEILLALVDSLAGRVTARYQRLADKASTPREKLFAFLDAHVALGNDASPEAVACWVAIGAESLRHP